MKLKYKFVYKAGDVFISKKDFEEFVPHKTLFRLNEWHSIQFEPIYSKLGYHCSQYIPVALVREYWGTLALVETGGRVTSINDVECWESMRIIKTWDWTLEMSMKMLIFTIEQILPIWGNTHPDDQRPMQVFDIICQYKNTNQKKDTARAADVANSAKLIKWQSRGIPSCPETFVPKAIRQATYATCHAWLSHLEMASFHAAYAVKIATEKNETLKKTVHEYCCSMCKKNVK